MPRNPGIPHYRKIADALMARASEPSGKTPSERALALRFGVARNTARRALEELRKRGIVTRMQGSGTYVRAKAKRTVLGFGYLLQTPHFARLFEWLGHKLAESDYHLIIRDTGLHGEGMREAVQFARDLRADAVFWLPSSHPLGIRAAALARRNFPPRLPLLLVNDLLGLSLQGSHRFDLVHYDYAQAAHRMVARLLATGHRHLVLVRRSDVALFSTTEIEMGFRSGLADHGIANFSDYVLDWNVALPGGLKRLPKSLRAQSCVKPDAFILPYPCREEFLASLEATGIRLGKKTLVIAFGEETATWSSPIDFRDLAEICSELLLSRLRNPSRVNLRIAISLPVVHHRQNKQSAG
jgi:DNA-binding LacI/PurR family transcriptional regulator